MAISGETRLGNARNNFLYGTAGEDILDGRGGDDYLRGYAGDDRLTGGIGADRFVFERTWERNGTDTITDFEVGVDILDFSLVGFSRGALNQQPLENLIRIERSGADTVLKIDLGGSGEAFQTWAVLSNIALGAELTLRIGARTETVAVQGPLEPTFKHVTSLDGLFDDAAPTSDNEYAARVGDQVRGLTAINTFIPGGTTLPAASFISASSGSDAVANQRFEVYYGTHDGTTFTITSTPATTADPTAATHTMVLWDSDPTGAVGNLQGWVLDGVYAENQWGLVNGGAENAALNYYPFAANGLENVLYGAVENEGFNGGDSIDIIYAGAGNDRVYGGNGAYGTYGYYYQTDGNDWLYGEGGADTFIVTDVQAGGIDVIQDFDGAEGDVIAFFSDPINAANAVSNGIGNLNNPPSGLTNRGDITLSGNTLQEAVSVAFPSAGASSSTVYQFSYGGKTYLYWDAQADGYDTQPNTDESEADDALVEITGAQNLTADDIYVNSQFT